ncbi:MAG: Uma2 family endonuclease [Deltaproteobacteria bacterium]
MFTGAIVNLPAHKLATLADLASLPEGVVGEIVDGELHAAPRPAVRHARASSSLGGELHGPFDRGLGGPGGWIILDEPELHLSDDVLVPDLAGWRRTRLPELPDTMFLSLAPDWVCEVLSPTTERHDRVRKMRAFARERVAYVWLLNPSLRTLEVYALSEGSHFALVDTFGGEAKVRAVPFDAIELDLAVLWGMP